MNNIEDDNDSICLQGYQQAIRLKQEGDYIDWKELPTGTIQEVLLDGGNANSGLQHAFCAIRVAVGQQLRQSAWHRRGEGLHRLKDRRGRCYVGHTSKYAK